MVATCEVGICYRPPASAGRYLIADARVVFDPSKARRKEKAGEKREKEGEKEERGRRGGGGGEEEEYEMSCLLNSIGTPLYSTTLYSNLLIYYILIMQHFYIIDVLLNKNDWVPYQPCVCGFITVS